MKREQQDELKEAIFEANPKLNEWNDGMQRFLDKCNLSGSPLASDDISFLNNKMFKKIGIAHVLLAMKKSKREFGFSTMFSENNAIAQVIGSWDFNEDELNRQSETTQQLIYDLLVG